MPYTAVHITLLPNTPDFAEFLSALLDIQTFEGITDTSEGYIAYKPGDVEPGVMSEIEASLKEAGCSMKWVTEELPDQNWNSIWESNFEPVLINDQCAIRAPFHDKFSNYPICITIEPKMSFGTGHHQTTRLMIEQMLMFNFKGKKVLDMGCGTGVLGILSSICGACDIHCIDNDKWACENTIENISRNKTHNIKVFEGGKEAIPSEKFDFILANINRNILIDLMPHFKTATNQKSILMLSGIMVEDANMLKENASENGFKYLRTEIIDQWMMILFERI
jgi:ribosomal protein L11 methyltransferase